MLGVHTTRDWRLDEKDAFAVAITPKTSVSVGCFDIFDVGSEPARSAITRFPSSGDHLFAHIQ